jgi:hypothetical protein
MQKLKSEPERALIADKQGMADIETIITQGKIGSNQMVGLCLNMVMIKGKRYVKFLSRGFSGFKPSKIMVAMIVSA